MNANSNMNSTPFGCKGIVARAAISGPNYATPSGGQKVAKFYFTMKNVQRKPAATVIGSKNDNLVRQGASTMIAAKKLNGSYIRKEGMTMIAAKKENENFIREEKLINAFESQNYCCRKLETRAKSTEESTAVPLTTDDGRETLWDDPTTSAACSLYEPKTSTTNQYCQTDNIDSTSRKTFTTFSTGRSKIVSPAELQIEYFEKELKKMRYEIDSMNLFKTYDDLSKVNVLNQRIKELENILREMKDNQQQESKIPTIRSKKCINSFLKQTKDQGSQYDQSQSDVETQTSAQALATSNAVCDVCQSNNEDKLVASIREELNTVLEYFQPEDIMMNIQMFKDNRYHISMIEKQSGKNMLCFTTNEHGINVANDDGIFLEYLTIFLADKTNTPEQKQIILKRAFGLT